MAVRDPVIEFDKRNTLWWWTVCEDVSGFLLYKLERSKLCTNSRLIRYVGPVWPNVMFRMPSVSNTTCVQWLMKWIETATRPGLSGTSIVFLKLAHLARKAAMKLCSAFVENPFVQQTLAKSVMKPRDLIVKDAIKKLVFYELHQSLFSRFSRNMIPFKLACTPNSTPPRTLNNTIIMLQSVELATFSDQGTTIRPIGDGSSK